MLAEVVFVGGGSRLMGDNMGEDRLVNPADFTLITPFASDWDNLISIARNELQPLASSRGAVILAYHDRYRSRLVPAVFRASLAKTSLANSSAERLSFSRFRVNPNPNPSHREIAPEPAGSGREPRASCPPPLPRGGLFAGKTWASRRAKGRTEAPETHLAVCACLVFG